jgi:transcriptional regulator CtsR
MDELDQYLAELGLANQDLRDQTKAEIYTYAFETAVARLIEQNQLTDQEKALVRSALQTSDVSSEALTTLFGSDARQQVLQAALTEALQITATAATTQ